MLVETGKKIFYLSPDTGKDQSLGTFRPLHYKLAQSILKRKFPSVDKPLRI